MYIGPACIAGAPTSCTQFLSDTIGCSASVLGCVVNGGLCTSTLAACNTLTNTVTLCNERR